MRMMGLGSVGYHEHTVAGRGDDPVAGALEYYASRGETPMAWGGAGAAWLGLDGEVDLDEWRAVFNPGGAHHPVSGERLVACLRPGSGAGGLGPLERDAHPDDVLAKARLGAKQGVEGGEGRRLLDRRCLYLRRQGGQWCENQFVGRLG